MNKELKIDLISDTHTKHENIQLPGGDILIHAGDVSFRGTIKEIWPFLEWFAAQKYTYKILVPGNHDFGFEQAWGVFADECKRQNIILLHDCGTTIEGIKVWGSAVQPAFCDWAFNRERGEDIKKHWDLIPADTELLITHGPPMGILDMIPNGESVGCKDLLDKMMSTKVKLHVFGHIHFSRGFRYKDGKTFVNAASVDEQCRLVKRPFYQVTKDKDGYYFVRDISFEKCEVIL